MAETAPRAVREVDTPHGNYSLIGDRDSFHSSHIFIIVGGNMYHSAHVEVRNNFQGSVHSFHHVGPGIELRSLGWMTNVILTHTKMSPSRGYQHRERLASRCSDSKVMSQPHVYPQKDLKPPPPGGTHL